VSKDGFDGVTRVMKVGTDKNESVSVMIKGSFDPANGSTGVAKSFALRSSNHDFDIIIRTGKFEQELTNYLLCFLSSKVHAATIPFRVLLGLTGR